MTFFRKFLCLLVTVLAGYLTYKILWNPKFLGALWFAKASYNFCNYVLFKILLVPTVAVILIIGYGIFRYGIIFVTGGIIDIGLLIPARFIYKISIPVGIGVVIYDAFVPTWFKVNTPTVSEYLYSSETRIDEACLVGFVVLIVVLIVGFISAKTIGRDQ